MKKIISEIQVTPVKPKDGLIAFASFILFGSIYCSSVAVYTRPNGGVRLVYPARKVGDKQVSVFYPINSQIGSKIESEVALCIKDLQFHHI